MKKITIVHIDDDSDFLDLCKTFLPQYIKNIEVITFESPKKALKYLLERPVNIIISDYIMPEMTGIDLLFLLRTNGVNTTFIILTGKGREEVAIRALNLGADYYLQKGLDFTICMSELSNFLRKEEEKLDINSKNLELEYLYNATKNNLDLIVNNLPDLVGLVKVENMGNKNRYRILEANKAFLYYSNLEREQVIGRPLDDIISKEDYQSSSEVFQKILLTKKLHKKRLSCLCRGKKMDFEVFDIPIINNGPEDAYILRVNRILEKSS